MKKLSTLASKIVIGVVVLAVVAGGVYYQFFRTGSQKTVTAQFRSAVGVYTGTPVEILGVTVGKVTKVQPQAQYVLVTMSYDAKYRIRAKDASAEEVANSLVSDRYINLGTLIGPKDSSPVLADHATIPVKRTGGPAELDDIYAQLDKLAVALGPEGANKGGQSDGALSALLKVSAANLKGNGAALGQSITKLAAAARTLADHKGSLFDTVKNLQKFTTTLKSSDSEIRTFNQLLAQVSGDLAGERSDLGNALHDLGTTLDVVSKFVKDNASKFHTDIKGLADITGVLVKEKASLNETLAVAPIALANIVHAYQPNIGSLGTRSNLASLSDTSDVVSTLNDDVTQLICSVAGQVTGGIPSLSGILSQQCNPKKSSTKTGQSGRTSQSSQTTDAKVSALLNGGMAPGQLIGSGS
jgi:phospholipid/cholesterol/gamma-HCH transport system substrate-binding protein